MAIAGWNPRFVIATHDAYASRSLGRTWGTLWHGRLSEIKNVRSRAEHREGNRCRQGPDGRDEVILFNRRGLCIYANARPAAIPTLYNETLYPGM